MATAPRILTLWVSNLCFCFILVVLIQSCIYWLQGFYCDRKPIFDTFLQIRGALELSHQAQVSAETVLFIHLNLIDNNVTGSPFKLAHDFLVPYFPNGGIIFCEVTFDVGSDSKIVKFHSMVNKLILELLAFPGGWKHIIFGISDHTDNTFGDPFVGYEGKKKIYIATPVNTVSSFIYFHTCTDSPKQSFWTSCLVLSRISSTLLSNHTYGCSVAALLSTPPRPSQTWRPLYSSKLFLIGLVSDLMWLY